MAIVMLFHHNLRAESVGDDTCDCGAAILVPIVRLLSSGTKITVKHRIGTAARTGSVSRKHALLLPLFLLMPVGSRRVIGRLPARSTDRGQYHR